MENFLIISWTEFEATMKEGGRPGSEPAVVAHLANHVRSTRLGAWKVTP